MKETFKRAKECVLKVFRSLKLKGGLDVAADIECMLKVRDVIGGNIEIRFDANQGYTAEQALQFVESVRTAKLELIEQPTHKGPS